MFSPSSSSSSSWLFWLWFVLRRRRWWWQRRRRRIHQHLSLSLSLSAGSWLIRNIITKKKQKNKKQFLLISLTAGRRMALWLARDPMSVCLAGLPVIRNPTSPGNVKTARNSSTTELQVSFHYWSELYVSFKCSGQVKRVCCEYKIWQLCLCVCVRRVPYDRWLLCISYLVELGGENLYNIKSSSVSSTDGTNTQREKREWGGGPYCTVCCVWG